MASQGFNSFMIILIPQDGWGEVCFAYVDGIVIHGIHGMILSLEVDMKGQV
jgi:hypothetical protein